MTSDAIYCKAHGLTVLPSDRSYSRVHIQPFDNKPYIILHQGLPGPSYIRRHHIAQLSKSGLGIIVPDLLGYRDSDKPKELEEYKLKRMAEDVISLLEALGVDRCFAVAHDWFISFYASLYKRKDITYNVQGAPSSSLASQIIIPIASSPLPGSR